MVVLDFSKSFNRLPHQRLLKKLTHYDMRGNTHSWIASFLCDRTQRVVHLIVCLSSAGSLPRQFWDLCSSSFFINVLPDKIASRTRLFADDCIVYRQIKDHNVKHLRRFYGQITGNQLPVHFLLFFTGARKHFQESGTER